MSEKTGSYLKISYNGVFDFNLNLEIKKCIWFQTEIEEQGKEWWEEGVRATHKNKVRVSTTSSFHYPPRPTTPYTLHP